MWYSVLYSGSSKTGATQEKMTVCKWWQQRRQELGDQGVVPGCEQPGGSCMVVSQQSQMQWWAWSRGSNWEWQEMAREQGCDISRRSVQGMGQNMVLFPLSVTKGRPEVKQSSGWMSRGHVDGSPRVCCYPFRIISVLVTLTFRQVVSFLFHRSLLP